MNLSRRIARSLSLLGLGLLGACAGTVSPRAERIEAAFDQIERRAPAPPQLADANTIDHELRRAASPAPVTQAYRLGPGDQVEVQVAGHPKLGRDLTLGPDGCVGYPYVGTVELAGLTRKEAVERLEELVSPFLIATADLTLNITHYENNKVYVLGRVEQPGVVPLTGSGTLLQAIASAGGLPVREFRALLSRAAVIRGSEEILWIDLADLLQNGNLGLNVPLRNGDVVFIPDSADASVFVMGEVAIPGAVQIKARLRITQALARAGGPTDDADLSQVYLLRPNPGGEVIHPLHMNLAELLETGNFREDIELMRGDIVYVARSGIGDLGYALRRLSPGLPIVLAGQALQGSD